MEKETTGLYLSGHPMDQYREAARRLGAVTIGSIMADFDREEGPQSYQDNQRVAIAGVISAYRTRTTRNNTLMAYVTLEDGTGTMELLCFSRVLEESGSYLQVNLPILTEGRISVRDEKAPQLMCDRVTPLSQVPEPAGAAAPLSGKLYLRFARSDDPLLTRVRNLFVLFPGQQTAVLYLADSKRRLGARCLLHPALLQELKELLGEENVVLQ